MRGGPRASTSTARLAKAHFLKGEIHVAGVVAVLPDRVQTKAYNQRGFPNDSQIREDSAKSVIRYTDVLAAEDLRGSDLRFEGCRGQARNVCKRQLQNESLEIARMVEVAHRAMVVWADRWGKTLSNSVSKLVMIEAKAHGRVARLFGLLARAYYSPKFSLWCLCDWGKDNSTSVCSDLLEYPFVVRICSAPCLVCPNVQRCHIISSDEFALLVARSVGAAEWTAWELQYRLADEESLTGMVVSGKGQELPMRAPVARAVANPELAVLKDMQRGSEPMPPARPSNTTSTHKVPSGAGHSKLGHDQQAASPPPALDSGIPEAADDEAIGVDEMPRFQVSDLDPQDALEVMEAAGLVGVVVEGMGPVEGERVGHAAQDSDIEEVSGDEAADDRAHVVGVALGAPATAPAAGPPSPLVRVQGPSELGYFLDSEAQRPLLRITPEFNRSVGVKCFVHPGKCTLAVASWKIPSRVALVAWALNAEPFPEGATTSEKDRIIRQHLDGLRDLRDAAQWPGRTRQSLIDEAKADAAAAGV